MSLNPVKKGDPHIAAHNAERAAINNIKETLTGRLSETELNANLESFKTGPIRDDFMARPGKQQKIKVLVPGSSNAAGQGASDPAKGWVSLLAAKYASTHEFVNLGVSGQDPWNWTNPTFAGTLAGFSGPATPTGAGRTILEQAIVAHAPHIVILAFAMQNNSGPNRISSLRVIENAVALCQRYGVRYIVATPYVSTGYSTGQKDFNEVLCRSLKRRGYPTLNVASIWGLTGPSPAVDSGDGLHLNDTGHAEQAGQVPPYYLDVREATPREIRFGDRPGIAQTPANAAAAPPLAVVDTLPTIDFGSAWPSLPPASWTITFRAKAGAAGGDSTVFSTTKKDVRLRWRPTAPNKIDLAVGATPSIVGTSYDFSGSTSEHHYAITYCDFNGVMEVYIDGVRVISGTLPDWTAPGYFGWTASDKFNLGVRSTGVGPVPEGTTFRHLTIHSTVLPVSDISQIAHDRTVAAINLWCVAELDGGLEQGRSRTVGSSVEAHFGNPPRINAVTP